MWSRGISLNCTLPRIFLFSLSFGQNLGDLGAHFVALTTGNGNQALHHVYFLSSEIISIYHHNQLLTWVLGIELRSSGLYGMHFAY